MNSVNKTLYIPLYGKAFVSRKGVILRDKKAEEIWEAEGFPLKGKSKSKWLAYYMGMRSAVFDNWLREQLERDSDAAVVHIGCGMDSRICRVGNREHLWLDIDFPEVIRERRRYYQETEHYRMLGCDIRQLPWTEHLPGGGHAIVVMEGVSMYLKPEELNAVLRSIREHFDSIHLLMDCYTEFAARASKFKNPINDVGVTLVYGMDDPKAPESETGLRFIAEHTMTPDRLIDQLDGMEQRIFKKVFAGKLSQKMYRLYEYR